MIKLACLDMAGTTITDDGAVLEAARTALSHMDALTVDGLQHVHDTMGQSKIVVFRHLFDSEAQAQAANAAFEAAYRELVLDGRISPLPGAPEALAELRRQGVLIAMTTGFSRSTQDTILDALGWRDLIDLALTPTDELRGRPYPDMVLHAVLQLGVEDVREVAVVGDSISDVLCGLRSGASIAAGVLTGAHTGDQLREAGATHILPSITDLPKLIST